MQKKRLPTANLLLRHYRQKDRGKKIEMLQNIKNSKMPQYQWDKSAQQGAAGRYQKGQRPEARRQVNEDRA